MKQPENVIPFPQPPEPSLEGQAECVGCHHRWEAVAPAGTVNLECPACHAIKGRFVYPVEPDEDTAVWHCDCGGSLFMVVEHRGYLCAACGVYQKGF